MRELPKIVKDAARLRAMIRQATLRMNRAHKYEEGRDLRAAARDLVRTCLRVWRSRDKGSMVPALCEAIDALKLELQLAKDVDAFRSWNEFEAIVRLVDEVGRQSGGWLKRLTPKGQSGEAASPPPQRAQILSSRPASHVGATP